MKLGIAGVQLRNMGKKTTILATVCIIIAVVVFFEFYVFKLSIYQTTTVSIITSDPSAWVNKTVVLEGNLDGPLIMMADAPLPYDYELNSSGQTIGLTFSTSVNLTSFYGNQYFTSATTNMTDQRTYTIRVYLLNSSITVRIYGIVREGYQYSFNTPEWAVYYIEAEKVERV
jgi:hypothetical protein